MRSQITLSDRRSASGKTRRPIASAAAAATDGVISRDALQTLGMTYVDVRTEVRAGRWRVHGIQAIAVHNGPLGLEARRWRGVQSLGELDFARMCRVRGLPEPERQVVRRGPRGRIYLDVRWKRSRLVVEIDGAQHREGLNVSTDNLSRNAVTLQSDRVLRIDLIGLRIFEDEFMGQVAQGLTL